MAKVTKLSSMASFNFKRFLKTVSLAPGVYLMKSRAGEVLYVGKAGELRKRLSSYARVDLALSTKTAVMLNQVDSIETIVTNSEKDALILEASLIKQYRPKYNVILRDDKNYPLIKVTVQEKFPRVMMARQRSKDGARYFGPFSSSSAMWETLRYLNSLFPLRRCKEKALKAKKRACLNYQMGRCLAPCIGEVTSEEYQELVRSVILVLEGKNKKLIRQLQIQMESASAELDFERAAILRDRIAALSKTLEKQQVVSGRHIDQDIFALVRKDAAVAVSLLFVRRGAVTGQRSFFLPDPVGNDTEILAEVVSRYYEDKEFVPHEVLLSHELPEAALLSEWLTELRGTNVAIICPQRGQKVQLIQMAKANGEHVFQDRAKQEESWQALGVSLQKSLGLERLPERIECLDISNISGQQAVGSLVCFVKGQKAKSLFRHYKIRTVEGPNDYAMMLEVLRRRFTRGKEEDDLPDLFLVDGGKGQLHMAVTVLKELNLYDLIDLAGIAKEREEEGEKLYRPGRKNPILLGKHSATLLYLMRIRDESHRYGVTFHRKLRNKKTLTSKLDAIAGVGKVRKESLLREIGSLKRVLAANEEELSQVNGIGPELARHIWQHLHGKS